MNNIGLKLLLCSAAFLAAGCDSNSQASLPGQAAPNSNPVPQNNARPEQPNIVQDIDEADSEDAGSTPPMQGEVTPIVDQPGPRPDPRPEPRPDPTPGPRPDPIPAPRPDPTPAPRPDPTPAPTPTPAVPVVEAPVVDQPEPQVEAPRPSLDASRPVIPEVVPEPVPEPELVPEPEPAPEPRPSLDASRPVIPEVNPEINPEPDIEVVTNIQENQPLQTPPAGESDNSNRNVNADQNRNPDRGNTRNEVAASPETPEVVAAVNNDDDDQDDQNEAAAPVETPEVVAAVNDDDDDDQDDQNEEAASPAVPAEVAAFNTGDDDQDDRDDDIDNDDNLDDDLDEVDVDDVQDDDFDDRSAASDEPAFLQEMLESVNAQRSQNQNCGGVSMPAVEPLRLHASLNQAAQNHAAEMAANDILSHTGSNGSSVAMRVEAQGYNWRVVAENIAAGQESVAAVVAGWMDSPGHCQNIMNEQAIHFGAGYALSEETNSGYGRFWVQVFAAPQ